MWYIYKNTDYFYNYKIKQKMFIKNSQVVDHPSKVSLNHNFGESLNLIKVFFSTEMKEETSILSSV